MKKNILVLFVLLLVLFIINSCERKPVNYYRKVYINGRYEVIGMYPVSDNMANKVNCYHFIYNKNGNSYQVGYTSQPVGTNRIGVWQK